MNIKHSLVNFVQLGLNQSKNVHKVNISIANKKLNKYKVDNNCISLSKQLSFSITHAKHVTDTHKVGSFSGQYKHFQKTATYVHCFNPKTHH
jgi:hypothetical protein